MSLISHLKRAKVTCEAIATHPLTRHHKSAAILRWTRWQIGSRLVPGQVIAPFVNQSRLVIAPGMHGATMNIFVGLGEFEEMGFLLHFLRPEDLVADVGANVGVFTVLASAAVGCRSVSFEPGEQAFRHLIDNIRINALEERVVARQVAVSHAAGHLSFTTGLDTLNHVKEVSDGAEMTAQVQATTLDEEFSAECPTLIKIDTEGFESHVLDGGVRTLNNPSVQALIVEIEDHSLRYGVDPGITFRRICDFGFTPASYEPFSRNLTSYISHSQKPAKQSNILFVRNVDAAAHRVASAPKFTVLHFGI